MNQRTARERRLVRIAGSKQGEVGVPECIVDAAIGALAGLCKNQANELEITEIRHQLPQQIWKEDNQQGEAGIAQVAPAQCLGGEEQRHEQGNDEQQHRQVCLQQDSKPEQCQGKPARAPIDHAPEEGEEEEDNERLHHIGLPDEARVDERNRGSSIEQPGNRSCEASIIARHEEVGEEHSGDCEEAVEQHRQHRVVAQGSGEHIEVQQPRWNGEPQ